MMPAAQKEAAARIAAADILPWLRAAPAIENVFDLKLVLRCAK